MRKNPRLAEALMFAMSWITFGTATASSAEQEPPGCRGEVAYPENPFRLEVVLPVSEARSEDQIEAEYALTNTTDQPIDACAEDWNTYYLVGPTETVGRVSLPRDTLRADRYFRIPPRARLSWKVPIVLFGKAGVGPVDLLVALTSSCKGVWNGTVRSAPTKVRILAKGGDGK